MFSLDCGLPMVPIEVLVRPRGFIGDVLRRPKSLDGVVVVEEERNRSLQRRQKSCQRLTRSMSERVAGWRGITTSQVKSKKRHRNEHKTYD